ncbi:helix-turn-helix domain-containing protein [Pseudomonas sp. CBMAI 2609]|uniref:Helix-turn-helix domain-containing protein n=2 Tax=Pseudomonas flavocrustae TaxID=2991719 RepID=A0ABT6IN38_9PSED|nr:helix-turn-helix transcriptional regulator [Pseudomonas sp. CBMAI 2609]MDH4765856.1 helix-turn-helix domain-containing protein [Pseudomonas sp. CBMAI 2609]
MELKRVFGTTLKRIRVAKGLTQEDFALVSSRTYLSSLERGLKCPTIEKLDQLADVLKIHPVTLLLAAYAEQNPPEAASVLLETVKTELAALGYR